MVTVIKLLAKLSNRSYRKVALAHSLLIATTKFISHDSESNTCTSVSVEICRDFSKWQYDYYKMLAFISYTVCSLCMYIIH